MCYGPKQVAEAVEKCAVQTLMVVDSLFRNANVKLRRQRLAPTPLACFNIL